MKNYYLYFSGKYYDKVPTVENIQCVVLVYEGLRMTHNSHRNSQRGPDWVSPPGETICDLVEEQGLTQQQLANALNLDHDDFTALIDGDLFLSPSLAERLVKQLGATSDFWLRREQKYRERLSRLEI